MIFRIFNPVNLRLMIGSRGERSCMKKAGHPGPMFSVSGIELLGIMHSQWAL
jgi:hypothetical protein